MLLLLFQLGQERYAIEASHVVAVVPRVDMKAIPHAPRVVAGLCRFRDAAVPVVDLTELALRRPSTDRLSSRIVLVEFFHPTRGRHLLGLLAEKVTHTMRCEPSDFAAAGVTVHAAPYLGDVTADATGFVQRIEIDRLLPASVQALLFEQAVTA